MCTPKSSSSIVRGESLRCAPAGVVGGERKPVLLGKLVEELPRPRRRWSVALLERRDAQQTGPVGDRGDLARRRRGHGRRLLGVDRQPPLQDRFGQAARGLRARRRRSPRRGTRSPASAPKRCRPGHRTASRCDAPWLRPGHTCRPTAPWPRPDTGRCGCSTGCPPRSRPASGTRSCLTPVRRPSREPPGARRRAPPTGAPPARARNTAPPPRR